VAAQVPQPVTQVPAIPFKQPAAAGSAATSGGIAVLVVSLIAIAAVLYLRKRLNLVPRTGQGGKRVRILETQMLGPRAMLAVVEFGGREHLIAHTEHGVTRIADTAAGTHE
jgi:flagellar biogenesis protein FliO